MSDQIKYAGLQAFEELTSQLKTGYVTKDYLNSNLKITKKATAENGYSATYELKNGDTLLGVPINIPKDFLVKGAEIKTYSESEDTELEIDGIKDGDKYIDFIINTAVDSDKEDEDKHLYLLVQDLVDIYHSGNGIVVNSDNSIEILIDKENANGLKVTSAGLALELATTAASGAMSSVDKQAIAKLQSDLIALQEKADGALKESDFIEITKEEVQQMMGVSEE